MQTVFTRFRTGESAAAHARVVAAERAAAATREAATQQREQKNNWLGNLLTRTGAAVKDYFTSGTALEHLKVAGQVLGGAAAVACIVASAGACAILGGIALGVAVGSNAWSYGRGEMTAKELVVNTSIDAVGSFIPGVRAAKFADPMKWGGSVTRTLPLDEVAELPMAQTLTLAGAHYTMGHRSVNGFGVYDE